MSEIQRSVKVTIRVVDDDEHEFHLRARDYDEESGEKSNAIVHTIMRIIRDIRPLILWRDQLMLASMVMQDLPERTSTPLDEDERENASDIRYIADELLKISNP